MQFLDFFSARTTAKPAPWKVSFEKVKQVLNGDRFILINTLPETKQEVLIRGTMPIVDEVRQINNLLENGEQDYVIVIYGENYMDDSVIRKRNQLLELGFTQVYCYIGGLFEWLLMQDVYGGEEFATAGEALDLLRYRPT